MIAVNEWVIVKRDETDSEKGGLIVPTAGREKPHSGTIISVGVQAKDKNIRKSKKAFFHRGVGFEIEYNKEVFLVLRSEEILFIV
jgi:co-chaperonin GroES (HSP10)